MMATMDPSSSEFSFSDSSGSDTSGSEKSGSETGAPETGALHTGAPETKASDKGARDGGARDKGASGTNATYTNSTDSPAVEANSSDTDSFTDSVTGSALNDSPRPPLVGAAVRLRQALPYLKTADPMPMLRPPDLIDPGELGQVMALRPLDQRAVRFRRGTFLLAAADLEPVAGEES
jgi:hypothetical protein